MNPDGFLPVGTYEVCFAVIKIVSDSQERLTEACQVIDVEPISPPILTSPPNNQPTEMPRPFFTWLPPSPATGFNGLTYNWMLVEVQPSQQPSDAIQQNIPVHQEQYLNTNALQYPATLPALDTGKLYAWQVAAKSSGSAISKSEIWSFKLSSTHQISATTKFSTSYSPLKRDDNAGFITTGGFLHIQYLNEVNDAQAEIKIFDITSPARRKIMSDSPFVKLRFGQNFIDIKIEKLAGVIDKHIYVLQLENSKGEHWYIKFQFIKPDSN